MNLLTYTATHNVEWTENDSGQVVLTCPRIINPFMKKIFKPFIKKQYYKVTLDDFGSFVWKHIDNTRTIKMIADLLYNEFGESIQPVYERLGIFINTLGKHNFIILHSGIDETVKDSQEKHEKNG